jgi:hypothetical protein
MTTLEPQVLMSSGPCYRHAVADSNLSSADANLREPHCEEQTNELHARCACLHK